MASAAVLSVWPLRGDHQGQTSITIHGTGFETYDVGSLRCCWDHHPGYLPSQLVASNTSFPERSTSTVIGGDGVPDVETPVDSISTVSGGRTGGPPARKEKGLFTGAFEYGSHQAISK